MERLEIIVNLYTIENRLQNSKLSDEEKAVQSAKFNTLLSKLKKHRDDKQFDTPQDLIRYFKLAYDFPENFNNKKTRERKFVRFRYIAITFIKHIFNDLSQQEIVNNFTINRSNVSRVEKFLKDEYDTNKKFKSEFNDMQIDILGDLKIFS